MSNKNFFTTIDFVDDEDYASDVSDNSEEEATFDEVKMICCEEFEILDQAMKKGISWYDLVYSTDTARTEVLKNYLKSFSSTQTSTQTQQTQQKSRKQVTETESTASEDTWILVDKAAPLGKRVRNQNKTEKYPIRKQKQTAKKART